MVTSSLSDRGPDPVHFLVAPGFSMLGLFSATEPLRVANQFHNDLFSIHFVSVDGLPVRASNGIDFKVECSIYSISQPSAFFICAGFQPDCICAPELLSRLRTMALSSTILGGIDTGSVVLARAGVLKNYRATVHWEHLAAFKEDFLDVKVTGSLFEVVERIRASKSDVILNLMAGMGADFVPSPDNPALAGEGSDMADAHERVAHVLELQPEMCTLDCGSLNYADTAYISTPDQLREMARLIDGAGVKPEIECFELGHIWLARTLIEEGCISGPPLFQLCMGIPYGAPATTANLLAMRNSLPTEAHWASFAIGKMEMPFVAQSMLLGGHVRVGLEDNLYLKRGVKATNEQLVEKGERIVEDLGGQLVTPNRARQILGLAKEARNVEV